MRMQQTDSVRFYDVPYHKKVASKHIKAAKTSISRCICRDTSEFLLLTGTMDFSQLVIVQAVQCSQHVCHEEFFHVDGL